MENKGLVSIITPSYNCEKYIGETIESILAQTYKDWELLITDDCSTDKTRDVIEFYSSKDPRIKLFKLEKNSGAGVARNNSIREAKGKYIAFCDSDDLWLPNKLYRQLEFMEKSGCHVSHTSSLTCMEDGTIFGFNPAYKSVTYKQICNCDKCGTTELIYDASAVGKLYMPDLRKRQDWAFKILLLKKAGISLGMFDTLSVYRIRKNSLSRKKNKLIKYNLAVYRTILGKNFFEAWFKFLFGFMPAYILKKLRQKIANSNL